MKGEIYEAGIKGVDFLGVFCRIKMFQQNISIIKL